MLLEPGACTAGGGAPPSTPGSPSGRCSLGKPAAGRAARVPLDHVSSFMGPRGTFLIISPCNLINLRSVMNLEISIKNIITNQDRIQNSQGALDSFTVAGGLGSNQDLWALCGQSLFWTCIHSVSHFCSSLPPSCQTQGSCILPPAWEIQPEFPSGFCFWQKNASLQNKSKKGKAPKNHQNISAPQPAGVTSGTVPISTEALVCIFSGN